MVRCNLDYFTPYLTLGSGGRYMPLMENCYRKLRQRALSFPAAFGKLLT